MDTRLQMAYTLQVLVVLRPHKTEDLSQRHVSTMSCRCLGIENCCESILDAKRIWTEFGKGGTNGRQSGSNTAGQDILTMIFNCAQVNVTFLLFLKMADEQSKPPYNKKIGVPKGLDWASLLERDGEELE